MAHASKHRGSGPALHHAAAVHHHHVCCVLRDHAQIVRDQQQRHAALLHQVGDQVQDLALDGDVQRCGRFIGNQQIRPAGQRHRYRDALALTTGKLVGVGAGPACRIRDTHPLQQLDRLPQRRPRRGTSVQHQRFGHLVSDGVHRVQRRHRLLEDHADAVATQLAQGSVGQADQFLAVKADAARSLGPLGQQAH